MAPFLSFVTKHAVTDSHGILEIEMSGSRSPKRGAQRPQYIPHLQQQLFQIDGGLSHPLPLSLCGSSIFLQFRFERLKDCQNLVVQRDGLAHLILYLLELGRRRDQFEPSATAADPDSQRAIADGVHGRALNLDVAGVDMGIHHFMNGQIL